ncbi:MAG: phosphoribosylglycinamide formyltransferase [Oscillospiraceae bacterium]|jgi:phosphoribosylglycinamide formyltransferase-1|nr:phosphoribosylglycinamide formyltransferase [Oscillospiraceae bacterium]
MNITVCVSGGGTNLQSLIDNGIDISLVIASKPNIYAIERANAANIPVIVGAIPDNLDTDLIVLAGYLRIVPPEICDKYRVINIHPALLSVKNKDGTPKYGGVGMYGLNVHRAVLTAHEKYTGATVHYVTAEVDGGEIILEKSVEIPDNIYATPDLDTAARELQRLVMDKCERVVMPMAVRNIIGLGYEKLPDEPKFSE